MTADKPHRRDLVRLAMGLALTAALVGTVWATHEDSATALKVPTAEVEVGESLDITVDHTKTLLDLAVRSPAEAWLRAAELERSTERDSALKLIAKLWIARDPCAAMDTFERTGGVGLSEGWMFEMLALWMVADEEAATNWALSGAHRQSSSLIVGAIDWTLKHADNREPVLAFGERVFRRWAEVDPAAAWEAMETSRGIGYQDWQRGVAEVWFAINPRAALDAAVSDNLWEHRWVPDLVVEWAAVAPRDATEWALALTSGPDDPSIDEVTRFGDRAKLLAPALASLSVEAPEEVFALIQGFGEAERNQIYYHPRYWQQLCELLGSDPRNLAAWLARQPDEKLRISQALSIAALYREADPHEALQWALELPPKESGEALSALVGSIAERDPQIAEDIVIDLAEPDAQIPAAAALLGHRSQVLGPAVTYEWAVENLSPVVRQATSDGLFMIFGMRDPGGAVSAVEGIADGDQRLVAASYAFFGMVMAISGDVTPQQRRERMIAIDDLYPGSADLPHRSWGFDLKDFATYKLYHYWKDIDPVRASKYRERAERYDGPTK